MEMNAKRPPPPNRFAPLLLEAKRLVLRTGYPFKRRFGLVDRRIIAAHAKPGALRKLHIGCGRNVLEGWLNSDLYPRAKTILHLDATRPFPLEDDWLDYIFSEHMIEHVPYSEGVYMLGECHRVLRDGGSVRISTPNLEFLLGLYGGERSQQENEYIQWMTDRYLPDAPYCEDVFIINNHMRRWGHCFIYDEKTLRAAMEKAGFRDVTRCSLCESEHEPFRNLEYESRLPEGLLRMETLTMEGRKSTAQPTDQPQ